MKKLVFENIAAGCVRRGVRRNGPIHRQRQRFTLIVVCVFVGIASIAIAQPAPQGRRSPGAAAVRAVRLARPLVELLPPVAITEPPVASQSPLISKPEELPTNRGNAQAAHWLPPQPPERPSPHHRLQSRENDGPVFNNFERSNTPAHRRCEECEAEPRYLQFLPNGLLYKPYLAGEKEPRFAAVWLYEKGRGWIWETAMGGRFGFLRYGTAGAHSPEGWQLDLEGAAFPRIDPIEGSEMDAVDFRAGILSTWRSGPIAIKAGYYHISSHVGDEYLLRNPAFPRIEYVRDSLICGMTYDLNDDLTVYGEVGYAVGHIGGAEPLELQFGFQYSPAAANGWCGSPFAAINGHLREEFGFGGNINIVVGRQWRGPETNHLFRAGFMYFNGKSLQYEFFDKHEELLGAGVWYDF